MGIYRRTALECWTGEEEEEDDDVEKEVEDKRNCDVAALIALKLAPFLCGLLFYKN